MADIAEIQIEGKSYAIADFELGELEWLEDELECTLDEVNPASMKAAVRFVYLIKRRDDPEFTMDDARKLKVSVFADPEDVEEESPAPRKRPTRAAPKAPAG
jgi:hypothetical protein